MNLMMCSRWDYATEFFPHLNSLHGAGVDCTHSHSISFSYSSPQLYITKDYVPVGTWETEHLC